MRITTPAAGYTGTGPGGVEFIDGTADVDLSGMDDEQLTAFRAGPLAYYRGAGYGIDGEPTAEAPAAPELAADPRDAGDTVVGTRLRDAAVDPRPEDYLTPTNAGAAGELGNPHGPTVVAPGIHGARGPADVLPGPVPDDTAAQADRETEAARRVLVDGEPTGDVLVSMGDQAAADAGEQASPAQSANKPAWVDHAVRLGADRSTAEQLTKAELIAQYDRPAPAGS